MLIEKLILIGYNRIHQNLIDTLEIDFTKRIQIILGSNGSGKSSIKDQLSPLPPNAADFNKEGLKEIHFRHNGKKYKAASRFGEDAGHYMECNGVVLNNWGTAAVQKALCKTEFGLTQEIYDVLSGTKLFTDMSPIDRRDWVMYLSGIDLQPLMEIFIRSKKDLNDSKAYVKKLGDQVKLEQKNLIDEKLIEQYNNDLKELKSEFNHYSKFNDEVKGNFRNTDITAKSALILDFMDELHKAIPRVPHRIVEMGVNNIQDLERIIVKTDTSLGYVNVTYQKALDNLAEIVRISEATALLSEKGIDEVEAKIKDLQSNIELHDIELNKYGYTIENPKQAKTDFLRIYAELQDLLFNIPDNVKGFDGNSLSTARAKKEAKQNRLTDLKSLLFKNNHRIDHINASEEVVCPQCSYSFKHGIDASEISSLERTNQSIKQSIAELEEDIKINDEWIDDCLSFIEKVKQVYSIMNLTPSNNGLWKEIKNLKIFEKTAKPASDLISRHVEYLEIAVARADYVELLDKEQDVLIKSKEAMNILENSQHQSTTKADQEISDLLKEKEKLEKDLEDMNNVYQRLSMCNVKAKQLTDYFDDFNTVYFSQLDDLQAEFVKDTKFLIMREINHVESTLKQAEVKKAIFKSVEDNLKEAQEDMAEHKVITDNLSPNTGLIADLLNSSIDSFTAGLNDVISAVWTSDLLVLPCVNKKNDLDWKFPVMVDHDVRRPDISKTSTSQLEIINLGFKLLVAQHLGHEEYPLYLDELGASMDEQHRINIMHVISDIVGTNQCSQLFMISHFAAFHEQLSDNETFVLNTKNIINLPKTYNQHVKIN